MDYDSIAQFLSRLRFHDLERLTTVLEEWEGEEDFYRTLTACTTTVMVTLENNPPPSEIENSD